MNTYLSICKRLALKNIKVSSGAPDKGTDGGLSGSGFLGQPKSAATTPAVKLPYQGELKCHKSLTQTLPR
jgi:hypothetical protein